MLSVAAKLLLLQSAEADHPSAILFMPEDKINRYVEQMERIHIEVLGYRLEGERIIFPDLGKIRLDQNTQL
ncbi:MAG: hypothetical protein MZV70_04365 [Desulfobacterales bacterium]|nr:hypothetical protein [Desulfobacterales bacterium]